MSDKRDRFGDIEPYVDREHGAPDGIEGILKFFQNRGPEEVPVYRPDIEPEPTREDEWVHREITLLSAIAWLIEELEERERRLEKIRDVSEGYDVDK